MMHSEDQSGRCHPADRDISDSIDPHCVPRPAADTDCDAKATRNCELPHREAGTVKGSLQSLHSQR